MDEKHYTYDDLSKRWGLAVNTLRQWKMQGKIVPIKVGGTPKSRCLFPESYVCMLEEKWGMNNAH